MFLKNKVFSYLIYVLGHFISLLVFLAPSSVFVNKGQFPFLYFFFSLQTYLYLNYSSGSAMETVQTHN